MLLAAAHPAAAQSAPDGPDGSAGPQAQAVEPPLILDGGSGGSGGFAVLPPSEYYRVAPVRVERGPQIDGRLDEEVWLQAAVIDEFIQQEPAEGEPATEQTVVRLLYDSEALYLGVEAYDSEPDGVIATEMRRDSLRLLDEDGNEVPDGEPGELFSSSPYQFQGYWNLPEQTEAAFRGDYLSVGDVALRDADGYIRLLDRKKNLIISGGENIYPTEVEQVLSAHPDIRDVAVVGVADPKWSQRVVAAVVPRPGQTPDARTLMDWSRERLASYKRPREIVFLEAHQMPRNSTGKILHRKLRDMLDGSDRA